VTPLSANIDSLLAQSKYNGQFEVKARSLVLASGVCLVVTTKLIALPEVL